MMAIELHDLRGELLVINFMAVLYMIQNRQAEGTIIAFNGGVTDVKESVEEIMRNVKTFAMQNQLRGH